MNINKKSKNNLNILDEIITVLNSNSSYDRDCASLYDVSQVIRSKYNEYYTYEEMFCSYFDNIIKTKWGMQCSLIMYNFDYINNELCMGFKSGEKFEKIVFSKEDKKLYVKESSISDKYDVMELLEDYLSTFYDVCLKYREFYTQGVYGIKPINSKFSVVLSSSMVKIVLNDKRDHNEKEFELIYRSYINKYFYECNLDNIVGSFYGREKDIFKNIFVKIEDCPKWSQAILYDMRDGQLEEYKKCECDKSKKLSLRNRIFSFLKK